MTSGTSIFYFCTYLTRTSYLTQFFMEPDTQTTDVSRCYDLLKLPQAFSLSLKMIGGDYSFLNRVWVSNSMLS